MLPVRLSSLARVARVALVGVLAACASAGGREGFEENTPPPAETTAAPAPTGDFDTKSPPPATNVPEVAEVFGHSPTTLYRLDPDTKQVTVVGPFDGCTMVTDIALDESSKLFAVTSSALYTVDPKTAKCTQIAKGSYPNSLSFVPKGTVDPSAEALVGYENSDYVRIDTVTGQKTTIGALGGGMRSSGDIVSAKGGATFLTVKSSACNDCLIEVDPATGAMKKNWGAISRRDVFGLAFWGGNVYGFDEAGGLFEVTFSGSTIKTQQISTSSAPSNLSFWGAGSTTSAPLVATPQ